MRAWILGPGADPSTCSETTHCLLVVFFPPLEQLCAEELQYSLEHDAYQIISGGGKVHKTQRKNPDDEYREGMKKKK